MPVNLFLLQDGWIRVSGLDLQPALRIRVEQEDGGRYRVRQLRLDATGDPISAADLREVPLSRIEAVINSHPFAVGDTMTFPLVAVEPDFQLPPGASAGGLTDDFLRDVSRAYAAAVHRGESPNVAIAAQTGQPLKSVQRWVYTARQRGIMPRGSKGRPG